MKKTPLYETHLKNGGEIVDFAGWALPVQYSKGIIYEHKAVRNASGLFDVSHMGEFMFTGKGAEAAINRLLTNDYTGMAEGKVRYSLMCNERGGIVDDVIVYKFSQEKYMMVVNASNRGKDAEWIRNQLAKFNSQGADNDCVFEDISDSTGQIAVQGPLAQNVLENVLRMNNKQLTLNTALPKNYYSFIDNINICGINCLVSRTGYTGEKGYEIYCDWGNTPEVYEALRAAGREYGIEPCGLGARDTLRLEAAMPLYGHELGEEILATETGLDFAIKFDKPGFIGKQALQSISAVYMRAGAKFLDRGIARENTKIYCGGEEAGYVTSGTFAPSLECAIAMIRIKKEFDGRPLTADVRGRKLRMEITPLPFYKANK